MFLINEERLAYSFRSVNLDVLVVTTSKPVTPSSKVPDIYNELIDLGLKPYIYDPFADKNEVKNEFGIDLISEFKRYEGIILAVSHKNFKSLNYLELKSSDNSIIFDLKSVLPINIVDSRL